MGYLHRKQKCLYFIDSAHSLGAGAFEPINLESAKERPIFCRWPKESDTNVVPIDIDGSLDKQRS